MKFERSIDVEEFSTLLFYELTNRYEVWNKLPDEYKETWLKSHRDHAFISIAGYSQITKKFKKYYNKDVNKNKLSIHFANGFDHRCTVDYFSQNALEILKNKGIHAKDKKGGTLLCYEHIIPKNLILKPLIEKAKIGNLTQKDVYDQINKYYFVACITKDEDKLLSENKLIKNMPDNWNQEEILARYDEVKISLIKNNIEVCE